LRQRLERGCVGFFTQTDFQTANFAGLRALRCRQGAQFLRYRGFIVVELRLQRFSGRHLCFIGGDTRVHLLIQQAGTQVCKAVTVRGSPDLSRQRGTFQRLYLIRLRPRHLLITQGRRTCCRRRAPNGYPVDQKIVVGILPLGQIETKTANRAGRVPVHVGNGHHADTLAIKLLLGDSHRAGITPAGFLCTNPVKPPFPCRITHAFNTQHDGAIGGTRDFLPVWRTAGGRAVRCFQPAFVRDLHRHLTGIVLGPPFIVFIEVPDTERIKLLPTTGRDFSDLTGQ